MICTCFYCARLLRPERLTCASRTRGGNRPTHRFVRGAGDAETVDVMVAGRLSSSCIRRYCGGRCLPLPSYDRFRTSKRCPINISKCKVPLRSSSEQIFHIFSYEIVSEGELATYDTGRGLPIGALTASVKHRPTFFAQSPRRGARPSGGQPSVPDSSGIFRDRSRIEKSRQLAIAPTSSTKTA